MIDSWQAQDCLKEKTYGGAHGTGRRSGWLAMGTANESTERQTEWIPDYLRAIALSWCDLMCNVHCLFHYMTVLFFRKFFLGLRSARFPAITMFSSILTEPLYFSVGPWPPRIKTIFPSFPCHLTKFQPIGHKQKWYVYLPFLHPAAWTSPEPSWILWVGWQERRYLDSGGVHSSNSRSGMPQGTEVNHQWFSTLTAR